MRVPHDHPLRRTYALLREATALAAAESLRGDPSKAATEGLVELLCEPRSAAEALTALSLLEGCTESIVVDALSAALGGSHSSVRLAAVESAHKRRVAHLADSLRHILRADESWLVRRAALRALADGLAPDPWCVSDAATDPHWRVRHALIEVLLRWGETEGKRNEIDTRLAHTGSNGRIEGLRAYLHFRWDGHPPPDASIPEPVDPRRRCPFWDWDVAVLLRCLERMGEPGRRQAVDAMPFLLGHGDGRVRGVASETLRTAGEVPHLVQALEWLDDPRGGAAGSVLKLMSQLDLDRVEAVARFVLHAANPSAAQLAWALDQLDIDLPAEDEAARLEELLQHDSALPANVRCALARLAARWEYPESERRLWHWLNDPDADVQLEALRGLNRRTEMRWDENILRRLLTSPSGAKRAEAVRMAMKHHAESSLLGQFLHDPAVEVRLRLAECLVRQTAVWAEPLLAVLQADPHPHVRAAALTEKRAAELVENPTRESSWYVLGKATRLRRVPLWELAPEQPWLPVESVSASAPYPLPVHRPGIPHARLLGPAKLPVAPMGISGHYGLPVEGFVRAAEAGVNLFFWEPNYQTLTEFAARLPVSERNTLHFLAGTFEADGERVRRDAERALRVLKVDRLALFLLFWVQSWDRVTEDVQTALERLRDKGLIAQFGLSTHTRPLALEAMEAGWNPVMVRHSAAHRGAEQRILPNAIKLGTSIITFNNTCYGRLLEPRGVLPSPRASDCYRYTLAQPGVTMCLSAPASLDELEENLRALRDPVLPDERRNGLLKSGAEVYEEDTVFRKLIRSL
jgi:aryl-alcohol dehydrogenase-like predicted oxidoreductase